MLTRALISLSLIALLILPASAQAGSFEVLSCLDSPTGTVNNAWQNMGASSPALFTSQHCAPNMTFDPGPNVSSVSGLSAAVTINADPPAGSEAFWRLTAPPGAQITQIAYRRYTGKVDMEHHQPFLRTNTGQVIDGACTITMPLGYWCHVGDHRTSGSNLSLPTTRATIGGLSASRLEFGVRCAAVNVCLGGALLHTSWASIYASKVTITENTVPSLSVDASHGAWAAQGWLKGSQEVRVAGATDTVGIKRLRVLVDGQVVATDNRSCDYTYTVPCSSAGPVTIPVDLSSVPEGQRTLTVQATDAAENTTQQSTTISVDATPPAAPQVAASSPQSMAAGQTWSLDLTHPATSGSPVTALRYRVCHNGACSAVQHAASATQLSGVFTEPGSYEVRAWAVDAAGNADENTAVTQSFWVLASSAPQGGTATPPAPPTAVAPRPAAPATTTSRPAPAPPATAAPSRAKRVRPSIKILSARRSGRAVIVRVRASAAVQANFTLAASGRDYDRSLDLRSGVSTIRVALKGPARKGQKVTAWLDVPGSDEYFAAQDKRTLALG